MVGPGGGGGVAQATSDKAIAHAIRFFMTGRLAGIKLHGKPVGWRLSPEITVISVNYLFDPGQAGYGA